MPAQPLLIARCGRAIRSSRWSTSRRMSSAAPSRCAAGRFSIPSLSAARATLNASIESDLPALARRAASAGHVLRRDPHDPLAAGDQKPLKRAGHVPAVLDRPHPLWVERSRPAQQLAEAALARAAPSARRARRRSARRPRRRCASACACPSRSRSSAPSLRLIS